MALDPQTLRQQLRGELLTPQDSGYHEARRVWNAMIDRRPRLVARCRGVSDVVAAVRFARDHDLEIAVRGGGHNVAGSAVCDDGLMIDLSSMKSVRVDPAARTARAEAGANWGDYDRETQLFKLASPGGAISSTGIAGLTLGGGFGWLSRSYGLACDNLLSADVVTAEGRVLTASAEENPDLFWALRGGGGNFGIVTSFEFRLHPVRELLAGLLVYPRDRTRELFELWSELTAAAPDQLGSMAALLNGPDGGPVTGIFVVWNGPHEEGEKVLAPLREHGALLDDQVAPTPYCVVQTAFDPGFPPGKRNYWKSHFLREVEAGLTDALVEASAKAPSTASILAVEHLFGGAVGRVGADETAFGARELDYNLLINAVWEDPAGDEANRQWARDLFARTQDFSPGSVYVNYLNHEEQARVSEAYRPEHLERLQAIKRRYDPENVFHCNQNIVPAAA